MKVVITTPLTRSDSSTYALLKTERLGARTFSRNQSFQIVRGFR